MALERYLDPSQTYVPVDLVARDERTIVLDLEHDDLSRIAADACALLGVMSYLFDVPAVLEPCRSHRASDPSSGKPMRSPSSSNARFAGSQYRKKFNRSKTGSEKSRTVSGTLIPRCHA